MKREDFANESISMDNRAREILLSKNKDYGNDDALWNFKTRAQIHALLKIDMSTPTGIALNDTLLKVLRICNLLYLTGNSPTHESIKDSFIDAHNYITIAYLCWLEANDK